MSITVSTGLHRGMIVCECCMDWHCGPGQYITRHGVKTLVCPQCFKKETDDDESDS